MGKFHVGRAPLMGIVAVVAGTVLVAAEMTLWYFAQDSIILTPRVFSEVGYFFALEVVYLGIILGGLLLLRRTVRAEGDAGMSSVSGIIGNALNSRRDLRVGAAVGIAYGVFYALVSSIVVYQPTVDFAAAYGASSPGVSAVACCGSLGTTPELIVYLLPNLHLGLQIIPLDLLFLFLIPVLIAVNAAIAYYALRKRPKTTGGVWLGGVASVVGLFTACPTCAGYFLAGAFGGLGATTLAVALAPLQLAFVSVSIPLLILSPFVTASSLKRAYIASCKIQS
ncbi:MAG: hypothetical protein OK422_01035 [Thaumarchaeota archaeon]|nr:hypothetical protein [Nitrososphaerota archaeon]